MRFLPWLRQHSYCFQFSWTWYMYSWQQMQSSDTSLQSYASHSSWGSSLHFADRLEWNSTSETCSYSALYDTICLVTFDRECDCKVYLSSLATRSKSQSTARCNGSSSVCSCYLITSVGLSSQPAAVRTSLAHISAAIGQHRSCTELTHQTKT